MVAGRNESGCELDQLHGPHGLYITDDGNILIADRWNHRIVEWKVNAKKGQVVAGGTGFGNRNNQLDGPTDVIVDKMTDTLIICDSCNRRVMRWSRRNGINSGETLIDNIDCWGLAMDNERYLYVSDWKNNRVIRIRMGTSKLTVVAGGNGSGDHLSQLCYPGYIFVDQEHSVYVSDRENHRVMKWVKNAEEGIVVAGGLGQGHTLFQLHYPNGLCVDTLGTIYVADYGNHRIMRWYNRETKGNVIVGGHGPGDNLHQLKCPIGLSFDRQGNLYVVDYLNNRVQQFSLGTS
ncbi:unnamed protein product [Rotaria sp. Silwood1]|nr:unnamed protein product [Rotaria sp. Silwood1]CAF1257066.1 unnamed protein product [Rotaria sp. Silwood1]CAF4762386.1 unnamed protein product [Rotaria sp. Silwood1]